MWSHPALSNPAAKISPCIQLRNICIYIYMRKHICVSFFFTRCVHMYANTILLYLYHLSAALFHKLSTHFIYIEGARETHYRHFASVRNINITSHICIICLQRSVISHMRTISQYQPSHSLANPPWWTIRGESIKNLTLMAYDAKLPSPLLDSRGG